MQISSRWVSFIIRNAVNRGYSIFLGTKKRANSYLQTHKPMYYEARKYYNKWRPSPILSKTSKTLLVLRIGASDYILPALPKTKF